MALNLVTIATAIAIHIEKEEEEEEGTAVMAPLRPTPDPPMTGEADFTTVHRLTSSRTNFI